MGRRQQLRQGRALPAQELMLPVGAVARGIEAGEERAVGRQGQRHVAVAILEAYAGRGEGVEPRRFGLGVTVGAEAIGAQGVDGDQQQMELGEVDGSFGHRGRVSAGRDAVGGG